MKMLWESAPYMVRVVECSHLSFLQVGLFIVKEKGACAFAGAYASDIAGFFRAAFVIASCAGPQREAHTIVRGGGAVRPYLQYTHIDTA